MRKIFAILDAITALIDHIPHELASTQDYDRLQEILKRLKQYNTLLKQLVSTYRREALKSALRLQGIQKQDVKKVVTEIFEGLEEHIRLLDENIERFNLGKDTLKKIHRLKEDAVHDLINTGLHDEWVAHIKAARSIEYHELEKLYALFEQEERIDEILDVTSLPEHEWKYRMGKTLPGTTPPPGPNATERWRHRLNKWKKENA